MTVWEPQCHFTSWDVADRPSRTHCSDLSGSWSMQLLVQQSNNTTLLLFDATGGIWKYTLPFNISCTIEGAGFDLIRREHEWTITVTTIVHVVHNLHQTPMLRLDVALFLLQQAVLLFGELADFVFHIGWEFLQVGGYLLVQRCKTRAPGKRVWRRREE